MRPLRIDSDFIGPPAGIGRRLFAALIDQFETLVGGSAGGQFELRAKGPQIGFGGGIVEGIYQGNSLTFAFVLYIAETIGGQYLGRTVPGRSGVESYYVLKRGMSKLLQQIGGLGRQGKYGNRQSCHIDGKSDRQTLHRYSFFTEIVYADEFDESNTRHFSGAMRFARYVTVRLAPCDAAARSPVNRFPSLPAATKRRCSGVARNR